MRRFACCSTIQCLVCMTVTPAIYICVVCYLDRVPSLFFALLPLNRTANDEELVGTRLPLPCMHLLSVCYLTTPQVKFTTPPKARHSLSGMKRTALKPLQAHSSNPKLLVGSGSPRVAAIGKNTKRRDLVS